ncbi:MAG: ATP-binding cassette domain-containing protein [Cellulomonadaceae bacterium]|jgi:putative ABC transport system ATP-binding protein|nr:ATP-binding cassette domain-containing protein [Cellulomonadaceae bacterium]
MAPSSSSQNNPILSGHNLKKSYGSTKVLKGVDFEIYPGEVVAVMGKSGSGKSTLLHLLGGLLTPDSGEVYLDGNRLDNQKESIRSKQRLNRLGFVFQFGDLVPELTVAENVELPLRLNGTGATKARQQTLAMLDRLGIKDQADKRLSEVSGGQAQRAAVARALVHQPAVVLADEPTGSLDQTTGELALEALVGAAKAQNTAVVLVTHDITVAAYADRDVLLRDGAVDTELHDALAGTAPAAPATPPAPTSPAAPTKPEGQN